MRKPPLYELRGRRQYLTRELFHRPEYDPNYLSPNGERQQSSHQSGGRDQDNRHRFDFSAVGQPYKV